MSFLEDRKGKAPPTGARSQAFTSARIDKHKNADPFDKSKKAKTPFSVAYLAGSIPCRVQHTGVKMYLEWEAHPSDMSYDVLLPLVAEGLRETDHPYVFVSRTAFRELLQAEGAERKVVPLLGRIVPSLRMMLSSPEPDMFNGGLACVRVLAECTLHKIEQMCGPAVLKIIKSKIPTYC